MPGLLRAIIVVGLATALPLSAATYYVDSHLGDDRSTGLSPKAAWRSLDRVNRRLFSPSDQMLFCEDRGSTAF